MGDSRGRRRRLVRDRGDGYLFAAVYSDRDKVMILDGRGDTYAFINGELRMGGKYAVKETYESWEPRFDYGQIPILLKKRSQSSAVPLHARPAESGLVAARVFGHIQREGYDPARCRRRRGRRGVGSIVVVNATIEVRRDLVLVVSGEGWEPTGRPSARSSR